MNRRPTPLERALEDQCDALGALHRAECELRDAFRAVKTAEMHVQSANRRVDALAAGQSVTA